MSWPTAFTFSFVVLCIFGAGTALVIAGHPWFAGLVFLFALGLRMSDGSEQKNDEAESAAGRDKNEEAM